jgi:putative ABC transport system permease protein
MIIEVRPMKEDVGAAFVPTRIGAIATTAFGALGALLATMGIYGLVAFSVSQRQREIGVRKAIGATTSDIVRLMARATTKPVAAGLLGGLVIGLLGARGLSSFIVGVSAYDPPTIVAAMALILMVTGAASAIPALRAAKVDALKAMKLE